LATGPLYVIYKLLAVVQLAKHMTDISGKKVVPVYWMATEDHDLEEIRSVQIFGKTYRWETEQTGAVGRMSPPSGIFWDQIPDCPEWLKNAYVQANTLSEAHGTIISYLLGETGLLVLDADDAALKHLALPMIQKELQSKGSELAMSRTNAALEALGYPTQVHARPVNLFYLHENQRTRIEVVENGFAVHGTSTTFTTAELLDLSTQYPERFSPNVVTRPLYQEIVLPNIAYIGGPAEVSYWLQLSDVFKWHEVPFPVVMPRYFATIVPGHVLKKMRKLGLEPKDFFANPTDLKAHWLQNRIGDANDLTEEKKKGIAIFEAIKQKAEKNDPSLSSLVEAEKMKYIKQLEYIEKKMQKASKAKETLQIQQLLSLSERIFPGGVLQERVENIFSYLINKPSLIQEMLEVFQPFQYEMHLLYPDENG
jgi:bacillithiol biosynthesis cysteine-adding enzyme BshC